MSAFFACLIHGGSSATWDNPSEFSDERATRINFAAEVVAEIERTRPTATEGGNYAQRLPDDVVESSGEAEAGRVAASCAETETEQPAADGVDSGTQAAERKRNTEDV